MAITALKQVQNLSSRPIILHDLEGPQDTASIEPGSTAAIDMRVPWATDTNAFSQHRIDVEFVGAAQRFSIWQAAIPGYGDFVRYSDDQAWHGPGQPVFGLADVGGDRRLVVFDDRLQLAATGGRHGITNLIRIDNGSGLPVTVVAVDGSGAPRVFDLERGESIDTELWVPWATSALEFEQHYIEIKVNGGSIGKLWQAERADGDFVRCSSDGLWRDPGVVVTGNDDVDGERALVVLDGTVELESAVRRPPPLPQEGDAFVTMTRPSANAPFSYAAEEAGHPLTKVVSVTNIARNVNDEIAVSLLVNLDTASGNVGRQRIEPADSSAVFADFPLDGQWQAIAENISAALLKNYVTLQVHWQRPPSGDPDVVRCVSRDNNGEIASIGGIDVDGTPWRMSRQAAIARLKNGGLYFTFGISGKRTQLKWRVSSRGEEFLYTVADNDRTNNLGALPTCPPI